jgi:hypothetical protein
MADDDRPDNDDDNVVKLRPDVKRPPVEVHGSDHRACKHGRIDLDRESRTATCRSCDAKVDLFDWLVLHAGVTWTRTWQEYKRLQTEVGRLYREEKELKRRVKNLKAQHQRWSNKPLPEEPVAGVAIQLAPARASSRRPSKPSKS